MRLERVPDPLVTRFAPAPTGHLHIGHVVNALHVWGIARAHNGRVLLRIEDHDGQRSRREYEQSILEDLAWLEFVPDEPAVRQSERGSIYERALMRLREQGLVYACECSRRDIDAASSMAPVAQDFSPASAASDELRYPGTCREKGLAETPGRGLRVRLPRSQERFDDLRLGRQVQVPSEQCGDLLVRDRHGYWTYQFVATVDDMEQGITLVIRGMDLLQSTGRQIQLARMLGRREPPQFYHHVLVMKSPDQKLSKSDGDTGIREMRAAGKQPGDVVIAARRLIDGW
jgi:glutamyl-tRNA synthetase/glutamyl-Q tRNA(Asp) synthetase